MRRFLPLGFLLLAAACADYAPNVQSVLQRGCESHPGQCVVQGRE